MRLVMLVPTFPRRSETFLAAKFAGLVDLGLDVRVVCANADRGEWEHQPALADRHDLRGRVVVAPGRRGSALASAVRHAPGALTVRGHPWRRVLAEQAVRSLRPDVVHAEFLALLPGRADLADLVAAPLTASARGYDVAYAGLDDEHHYDAVWPALSALHVLTEELRERAIDRGCPPDLPCTVIPPAVDSRRFGPPSPRSDRPGAASPLRIVTVARLHWKKGHEDALLAVRRVIDAGTPVHYRILGDGPHLEAVAFCRHQLGLEDHVELVGAVPPGQVPAELGAADVYLAGSVSEGFGNAVLEAQAAGLPVVATDAEGLPANVDDGRTGIVVPRRHPEELARAVLAIANDPGTAAGMGRAGVARAGRLDLGGQLEAFARFYERAVA